MFDYVEILFICCCIVLFVQILFIVQFVRDTKKMVQSFIDYQSELYLTLKVLVNEVSK
jgi:hypothetical protein